ncbi:MAG: alpha/beta fold hydrolase [Aristaeellaceae bacterium]|nr:alpha/beta hydrolase [Eubacteriales bacterium]
MAQDRYFEVEPGVLLRYIDAGEGQPIVFVPGWSFSANSFDAQIAYFSKAYRCIAVDPRCHGKSTITWRGNSYDQQGADLAKLIDALGLKHVVLAGWSFGALACWAYLEQRGFDNVAAVVIMDNSPRSISDDPQEYRAGTLEDLRGAHLNSLCSPQAYRGFMGEFADGLLYEGAMSAELREHLIDESCRIPSEIADALYVDGWLADKREICRKLDATVPWLLVIANYRKDAGVPYMQANYPHVQIDAFGMHMMFHEYPDRFNARMEEFLKGI